MSLLRKLANMMGRTSPQPQSGYSRTLWPCVHATIARTLQENPTMEVPRWFDVVPSISGVTVDFQFGDARIHRCMCVPPWAVGDSNYCIPTEVPRVMQAVWAVHARELAIEAGR